MRDTRSGQNSSRRTFLRSSMLACGSAGLALTVPASVRSASMPSALQEAGQDKQPTIDALMLGYMQRYRVPGASLAFMRGGQSLFASGYGMANSSKHTAVSTASRFRIASDSKAFTAAAVLLLIEQGRIQLTSTIFGKTGLLPEYPTVDPHRDWQESITIHDLLTHTGGGWRNEHDDPMFEMPDLNQRDLIAWTLRTHPLEYAPGAHYAYSNFGYCVLGRVLEKVTGDAYSDVVKESVLRPIGITDMQIGTNRTAPDEVRYYPIPGGADPYAMPIARMDSHGGWLATPGDLATFMDALFASHDKPGRKDLLSPASLRVMTSGTMANPGYGCGLLLNRAGNVWHNGSLPGTSSLMVHTHSGLSWAVILNLLDQGSDMLAELDKLMWSMARSVPGWQV